MVDTGDLKSPDLMVVRSSPAPGTFGPLFVNNFQWLSLRAVNVDWWKRLQ